MISGVDGVSSYRSMYAAGTASTRESTGTTASFSCCSRSCRAVRKAFPAWREENPFSIRLLLSSPPQAAFSTV